MNAMDRPIDPTFLRRQRGKRIAYAVVGVAALLWLSVWLPSWIRPALDPDRIRTAQVQWGAVEETITASGTVVPQFEQIIFSPINTRLVRILQKPGAMLQQGQPIVELDLNAARLDVEKRAEELALKQNRRTQLELDERKKLSDLDTRWRLKNLEFQRFKTRTAQLRELQGFGAVSEEELSQAHLQEQRAEIELQQLEEDRRNLVESTQAQLEALQLEMNILETRGRGGPPPLGARPHPRRQRRRAHRDCAGSWRFHQPRPRNRPHRRPQLRSASMSLFPISTPVGSRPGCGCARALMRKNT